MKLHFSLAQDSDGYPPVTVESVWAEQVDETTTYQIDNVPFFAKDATLGDIVSARADESGNIWFDKLVKASGNSLIRVVFFDRLARQRVGNHLESLGCATEYVKALNVLGVSIPGNVDLSGVQSYLEDESKAGIVDYEEPILRQPE